MPLDDRGDPVDRLDGELDRVAGPLPDRSRPPAVDAGLAETHRRVQSLDTTPGPDSAFVRHLMEQLMHVTTAPDGTVRTTPNGHRGPRPVAWEPPIRPLPAAPRRWRFVAIAVAALLLIAIGGVALAPRIPSLRPDRNPVIPAAIVPTATTAATPTATEETLVDIELPAELLPHGDQLFGGLNHVTIPTGATTWDAASGRCCPGVRVDLVLAGGYTVTSDGPLLLARAGAGEWETIPAGTAVSLSEGDATAFSNATTIEYLNTGADTTIPAGTAVAQDEGGATPISNSTSVEDENAGGRPVEILFWILFDQGQGTYTTDPVPVGWIIDRLDLHGELTLADGTARLRVRRVDLAPMSSIEPVGLQWGLTPAMNDDGTPVPPWLYARSDGKIFNDGKTVLTAYVLTLEATGAAGTPAASPTS